MGEKPFDVMLSYQWDHQSTVEKMRSYLESRQLKVWMDNKKMRGDINRAMAGAIHQSKVVILCLSKKYELSHNCKKEYGLVDKKRKPFVPIMMEKFDYEEVSALETILGNELYYLMVNGYEESQMESIYSAVLGQFNSHLSFSVLKNVSTKLLQIPVNKNLGKFPTNISL